MTAPCARRRGRSAVGTEESLRRGRTKRNTREQESAFEILACDEAGITVTLPKPQTSEAKSEGRFGKQDFRYVAEEDIYICPAGEKLTNHFTNEENGVVLHHYWTNAAAPAR